MSLIDISIIIPAYNAELFIGETLESIMRQSMQSFEVIIVNDGSKDGTQKVIDEYIKKYPEKIRAYYQENRGQSAARNHALKYVRGRYIAFIDADDTIAEWYLEEMYDAAEREKADIVVCSYQKFDTSTKEVLLNRYTEDWVVEFEPGYFHVFQYSPCARLCRTEFVVKYGFEFSVGEQLEDGPYCMMTDLLSDKTVVINKIGYYYRVYSNSTMGNVRKGRKKPKVPYNGIETAVKKVKLNTNDIVKENMLEFTTTKILAGLVTNMYKNCNREVRKEICQYCYYIMDTYFQTVNRNPYIKINKLKKLPFSHRVAVALFVVAYKMKLLYIFSSAVAFVLRSFGK